MAETRDNLGCILSEKDVRDYKLTCAVTQYFPKTFTLTNLPKVKNQETVPSCTAHATASILEFYDKNKHVLSTNFIFGIGKQFLGDTNRNGMSLINACKIVQEYGDMLEADCKGNTKKPNVWTLAEKSLANSEAKERAYKYRIDSYYSVQGINNIKAALKLGTPVLAAIKWYNHYSMKNGIITFDTTTGYGYHAVMIYGWSANGWLVQNSWGTSFGKNGRFVLPYDQEICEGRVMIDHIDKEDIKNNGIKIIKPINNFILNPIYKLLNKLMNK